MNEQTRTVPRWSPRRPRAGHRVGLSRRVKVSAPLPSPPASRLLARAGGVPLAAKEPPHHDSRGGQNGYDGTPPAHVTPKIVANDRGNPPGKLADAELHFYDSPRDGLKLIGFSI